MGYSRASYVLFKLLMSLWHVVTQSLVALQNGSIEAKKVHKCLLCLESFLCKKDLIIHHGLVHETASYKCSECECNKVIKTRSNFKRHLQIHEKSNKYSCTSCPASFNRKSNLNRHVL